MQEHPPVPDTLEWDLWLGPAANRPYNPMYLPGSWRGWSAFGSGTIGDWICHVVDPVFWALDLGAPSTVKTDVEDYDPEKHSETFAAASRVTFTFPEKGSRGPVTLYWYSGHARIPRPEGLEDGQEVPETGAVVLGDRGGIKYGSHGAGGLRIFPEEKMRAYKQPEPTIPRVAGHHQDFLEAIRNNRPAGSNFDYGGPLTELARLGIIGMQFPGQTLEWDGPNMRFTNVPDANRLIHPACRSGWAL
jgi:predicted dehydrogenase